MKDIKGKDKEGGGSDSVQGSRNASIQAPRHKRRQDASRAQCLNRRGGAERELKCGDTTCFTATKAVFVTNRSNCHQETSIVDDTLIY